VRAGGFDPAHALLVRAVGEGFQIVAGHHRAAAARAAGLKAVPCWVRAMDDDEAFIALVLANSQSELLPLERGMHALKAADKGRHGGNNLGQYATDTGRSIQTISREVQAAKVWAKFHPGGNSNAFKLPPAKNPAELHAAVPWLWPALVAALIAEGWNVACTRSGAAWT
jgi:hypothetical protein